MKTEAKNPYGLPKSFGNYSSAVICGDMMFLAGHGPFDGDNKLVGDADIKLQTRKSLDNIKSLLEENGFCMDDIVRSTVFLQNIGDWAVFNEIYGEYFTPPYPARTVVECNLNGFLVEIECTAVKSRQE